MSLTSLAFLPGNIADIALFIAMPVLLVVSAFFSGSETALFSLTRHQQRQLTRSTSLAANAIRTLLAETRGLLITLLLGNMTTNVLYFVLSSMMLLRLSRDYHVSGWVLTVATFMPLLAIILVGEVLPKLVATNLAMSWSKLCAIPLLLVHRAVTPIRVVTATIIITPLARLFAPTHQAVALSSEEFETLLESSSHRGHIDPGEEELLQQVLSLGQYKVRDIMRPRVDTEAFNLARPASQLMDLIRDTGLSRIPVYRGDLDHIVGVIHTREALLNPPADEHAVEKLSHRVMFVPELQRCDDFLLHLRKSGTTFAIAVDEYGGTAGLATIEDVVELLVGPIAGPYEANNEPEVTSIGPGRWRVSADLSVHDWADAFGQDGITSGVSTVGGLVMARLGRVPTAGDRTTVGNLSIQVEAMKGRRIGSLLLELRHRGDAPEPAGASGAGGGA